MDAENIYDKTEIRAYDAKILNLKKNLVRKSLDTLVISIHCQIILKKAYMLTPGILKSRSNLNKLIANCRLFTLLDILCSNCV